MLSVDQNRRRGAGPGNNDDERQRAVGEDSQQAFSRNRAEPACGEPCGSDQRRAPDGCHRFIAAKQELERGHTTRAWGGRVTQKKSERRDAGDGEDDSLGPPEWTAEKLEK